MRQSARLSSEDYRQWKDGNPTREILARLGDWAKEGEIRVRERAYDGTTLSAQQWADLQGALSFERGFIAGLKHVVGLEFHEIATDEEKEAENDGE